MTEKHTHQTFNVGVKALIVQDSKVLVLKRKDHPVWELPGGRINQGESIQKALRRELAEEIPEPAEYSEGSIIHAEPPDFELPNGNRLLLLFFAVQATLPFNIVPSPEHEAARWVNLRELQDLQMKPPYRYAAVRALTRSPNSI